MSLSVPNRIGKKVNIFASNWWARVASENERDLVNSVCIVFEQGDEMLTRLSMEKQMVECNLNWSRDSLMFASRNELQQE